ncbi:MAG: MGMT family protein [Bacillota bacterium]
MSNFFEKVYEIAARIPEGKVATYGQIAAILGNPRAARTVGWAMGSAPSDRCLPCHRVVNRQGCLSPPSVFGEGVQRILLESEGVTFLKNGCINMKKHLWKPDESIE